MLISDVCPASIYLLILLWITIVTTIRYGDPLVFDNSYYTALLERPWESKTDKMVRYNTIVDCALLVIRVLDDILYPHYMRDSHVAL